MKQTQIGFLHLAHRLQFGPFNQINSLQTQPLIKRLHITARKDTTHHMRDGEVVLYLRPDSRVWQVRYKLFDRKWRCVSTRHRQLDWAKRAAGEIYDRARFRQEEGLPQKSIRFSITLGCINESRQEIGHSGLTCAVKTIKDDSADAIGWKRKGIVQDAF